MNRRIKIAQSRKRPVGKQSDRDKNECFEAFFQPNCAKVMSDVINPKIDTRVVYEECADKPILCATLISLGMLNSKEMEGVEVKIDDTNREAIDRGTERVRQMTMEINNREAITLSPVNTIDSTPEVKLISKVYICYTCKLNIEDHQKRNVHTRNTARDASEGSTP